MDKELTVEEKRQELIRFCKQQKRHGGCGTCPLYEDAEPCEVCGFDDRQVFSDLRIVRLYSRLCDTPVNYTLVGSNARDVVEVVRCKDCEYYDADFIAPQVGWCNETGRGEAENHYCAHGRRKKDGGEDNG